MPPSARLEVPLRPGVTFPDWSVVASETVREALDAVLEAFGVEERWSGIEEAEDRVRRAILENYGETGNAPSVERLSQTTGIAPREVSRLLGDLATRDIVVLGDSGVTITGAYPLTERVTGHRVRMGERVLNAMCAIDALGVGAMYDEDVTIESVCQMCGDEIRVNTRDRGAALAAFSPTDAVVWVGTRYADGCAATSMCTTMAFFCSDGHLAAWRETDDAGADGFRLSMDEGLQAGKALFMPLLARARPSDD